MQIENERKKITIMHEIVLYKGTHVGYSVFWCLNVFTAHEGNRLDSVTCRSEIVYVFKSTNVLHLKVNNYIFMIVDIHRACVIYSYK